MIYPRLRLASCWALLLAFLQQSPARPQRAASVHPPEGEFRLSAAFYDLAGRRAWLMINNKGPDPVPVGGSAYDPKGEERPLKSFEVPGNSFLTLPLEALLDPSGGFRRGSLELRYHGHFLQVGAQLEHRGPSPGLGFAEQLSRPREFKSGFLRGNWALPETRGTRLLLLFANASPDPVTAEVETAGLAGGLPKRLRLEGRQSRAVEVVPARRLGRVSVSHDGEPGDLLVRALAFDPKRGFATLAACRDPRRTVLPELHADGLRLGEGAAPVLALSNHSEADSRIEAVAALTLRDGGFVQAALPAAVLPAGGSLDLGPALLETAAVAVDPALIEAAGVRVLHSSPPGTVTGFGMESDARGLVHPVPVTGRGDRFSSAGTYPWSLEKGRNTVFHVKNLTGERRHHRWYLTSGGRVVHASGPQLLEPWQAAAVDIAGLRESGVLDWDAERGQIHWTFLGSGIALGARVERIGPFGEAAFSYECASCCNDTVVTEVFPSAVNAVVGDPPVTFTATQHTEDCNGNRGPAGNSDISHIWFNGPAGVVSLQLTTLTCVGPGSGTAEVFVSGLLSSSEVQPEFCPEEPQPQLQQEPVLVPIFVDPSITITGPVTVSVGEVAVPVQTVQNPSDGTLSNWRVASGDQDCIDTDELRNGRIKAFADGRVGLQVDYTARGRTVHSNTLEIVLQRVPQYVRLVYLADADAILSARFTPDQVAAIKTRVEANLRKLFIDRAGANVVIGSPPSGILQRLTVRIRGDSAGGQAGDAGFDLMNRRRDGLGTVFIGRNSLDLASSVDPVSATLSINERTNVNRVGDALARLVAHEVGHSLGLVPQQAEISLAGAGYGLAAKLGVSGLGFNGTPSHHNPSSSNNVNIMFAVSNLSDEAGWNIAKYDFAGRERTYLDRILP